MLRKRQKRAIDTVLTTTHTLLDWPDDEPLTKTLYWQRVDEQKLRESLEDLRAFKHLEERGYGALLLARYPSMRKYFGEFIQLPFAAERGSDDLLEAIDLIRKLDSGELKHLPANAPTEFVPMELRRALKDRSGNLSRNAWEMGLALAVKDAFRSGDLYLPQSKHHVSFWDLMLSDFTLGGGSRQVLPRTPTAPTGPRPVEPGRTVSPDHHRSREAVRTGLICRDPRRPA